MTPVSQMSTQPITPQVQQRPDIWADQNKRNTENSLLMSGDIIAKMKNHAGEPVVLQRGEAILGENGNVIVHGKPLGRETGTVQNYGLDKMIYRHEMPRNEVTQIPKYIKQQPFETNMYGQNVYTVQKPSGEIRIITSPTQYGQTVSSMYYPK